MLGILEAVVVKVGVDGIGDNHQFLISDGHALAVWILARHLFEGVLREVAAVGLLAVDEQDGRLSRCARGNRVVSYNNHSSPSQRKVHPQVVDQPHHQHACKFRS